MNARNGHFVNRAAARATRSLGLAAACGLLSGCIGNPFADAQVDPRSPIAKEVAQAVKPDAPYPSFAAVPARPKDVRPARQYGAAAARVDKAAAELAEQTSPDKFSLENTGAFAAQAQAAAGSEAAPTPGRQAAETEAFAAALRKRATPPPPEKH